MQQKYQTLRSTPKLNVLIAYPYFTDRVAAFLADMGDDCRCLIDSGAFTAFKSGKPIKLDDYCQFLATMSVKPWRYFTLDEIGDADATMRNYQTMLERGFAPVPIFTRGAPLDHLDRYFATSDVVGLGGVAGKDPGAYRWLKYIIGHAAGRRVHILGFSASDWVKFFRPYSIDSSSWKYARYGTIPFYFGRGQIVWLRQKDFLKGMPDAVARSVRAGGFDPYALALPRHWGGRDGSMGKWVGASQFIQLANDMERNIDSLCFLAVLPADLPGLGAAYRAVKRGTLWSDEMGSLRERGLAA